MKKLYYILIFILSISVTISIYWILYDYHFSYRENIQLEIRDLNNRLILVEEQYKELVFHIDSLNKELDKRQDIIDILNNEVARYHSRDGDSFVD